MTISIWRYSHLVLAISSFLLLTLASVSGIILSFDPVLQKTQPYRVANFDQISLAETLPVLKKEYLEISELSVDANQFVTLKGTDMDGKNVSAYIDPLTAKVLGKPEKKTAFFQWVTTLHRSLFLHETGRFFIGITAFLLFLIATSGTVLILQRQRGIKHFFKKIVKESFAQYYHVVLGRLLLIPILIISCSGTYLSLVRFNVIHEKKISHKIDFDSLKEAPEVKLTDFSIFKKTKLSDVQSVEFPFSEDVEDYFLLKLKDREIVVNQFTGEVIDEIPYPLTTMMATLSLDLHTGRTNILWALVLALASANILFFIYSGFAITLNRRKNRIKNKFKSDKSQYIILIGSENGSTFKYANALHEQILKSGATSYVGELNTYTVYPKAEHIIILTATYGLGNPPTNAGKFLALLEKKPQLQPVNFSVLGFGSHAYPDFCKFAYEVNNHLSLQKWAVPLTEIHTVNDKSPDDFKLWLDVWSQKSGLPINIAPELLASKPKRLKQLSVISKTEISHEDGAFLIRLKPAGRTTFTSGDLLAIYPANDYRERQYSIGRVAQDVQLSVKLHNNGLGSGFLYNLQPGDTIKARIIGNSHFHFPKKASAVIMISNGTGIAPFLGMIAQNTRNVPCHLYCGFRGASSFELYQKGMDSHIAQQRLTKLNVAYSREQEKQYVKDLLHRDGFFIAKTLKENGVIMICGSLAMQQNVTEFLETICQSENDKSLSFYQSHNQVLMDCY
ncbi:PepSY domain-containing protein [Pedobacter duraquae]|uniref:Sulfite reductase (NADPH) flavoprotein alpha-component n=1 Tax=Pedobacter duraquae TaxID=425511 RepID=A0A4R6IQJ2_9SPHI|nr:PepSY domain-containing protein [Pedobacter duraquae]TDO24467.1 sulfite reductase (NADPH) flavoprotein alpha-component [Pedobacter duraquae]